MALRQFQASIALSTIQFCSGNTNGWELQKGQEQVISISRAAAAGGAVCERLTAGWRYWDLPDLEKLALRDQG